MPKIESVSSDHVYVGKGHRTIVVNHGAICGGGDGFSFVYDYASDPNQLKKTGRKLKIEVASGHSRSEVILGGKQINALKKMIEIAEREMSGN